MPLVSQNPPPPTPLYLGFDRLCSKKYIQHAAQPHWPITWKYPRGVSVADGKKRSCSNLKKMELNFSSSSTLRLRQQITTNKAELTANTEIGRSLKVAEHSFAGGQR